MFDMCVKLFYGMDILSDVKVAGNLTTDGNIDTDGYVVVRSPTGVGGVYANMFSVVRNFDAGGNCGFYPSTEILIKGNEIRASNAVASFACVSTCSVSTCSVSTCRISLDSVSITRFSDLKDILSIPYNIPRITEVVVTVPENCTKFQVHTTRTKYFPIVNVWKMNAGSGNSVQMDFCFDASTRKLYAEMAAGFSSSTNLKFTINEF